MNCGQDYSVCYDNNGYVWIFGSNKYGQLGINDKIIYSPQKHPNLINIINISCGRSHTLCLNDFGDVFSFGDNSKGQLGINENIKYKNKACKIINIDKIISISCGLLFSICLDINNNIWSFGSNRMGQLGHNDTTHRYKPCKIEDFKCNEISAGQFHCIFYSYDNLYISGKLSNINVKYPLLIEFSYEIKSFISGNQHVLFLTYTGDVYVLGSNYYGQLGLDSTIKYSDIPILNTYLPKIQKISCSFDSSMCIDINNNLWVFGSNIYSQLGINDNKIYNPQQHPVLKDIKLLSKGGYHSFVKTYSNIIYSFGWNHRSQLGRDNNNIIDKLQEEYSNIWNDKTRKYILKSARN